MHLAFQRPYLSIRAMDEVYLPSFSVIVGRNGVGKTQFLDAIAQGHVSVSDITQSEIQKYDINSFQPRDPARVGWSNCVFAERTAERYLSARHGKAPIELAKDVFLRTVETFHISDGTTSHFFEEQLRHQVRQIPDFTSFPKFSGTEAVVSYSDAIRKEVTAPLRSRSERPKRQQRSTNRESRTCAGDPAVLLSLSMKLSGKLPHELNRDDVLRAAYYEGDTIANTISQAFTRYKVEQYSWAHTHGEAGLDSVQNLLSGYRRNNTPPWVLLRQNLEELRKASDDPQLFNFEFSDPEGDEMVFADHANYSFQAVFRNRTNGESYSLGTLSSGEKILMSLCLATFNQTMGQGRPKLLLFDELDAVLHPSMISSFIRGLKTQFVDRGTCVILATHSVTTVSILDESEIYRLARDGHRIDIQPTPKSEAVQELSDGLATIDTGLRIVTSRHSVPVTILTEGHNALHLKKWASLFFSGQVDVFDDLPARTGKDQLLTYGQLLSKVIGNSHFLIVWDCDAKSRATKLANDLPDAAHVTPFAFDRRENGIAPRGIENKYEEDVLTPYANRVLDAKGVELSCSLDNEKKGEFAKHILENATREHFVHFGDLCATVTEILRRVGENRATCESS